MLIRKVNTNDYTEVSRLIVSSFSTSEYGYSNEAELVEKIRKNITHKKDLELVALIDGKIVGHGMLSQVKVINVLDESIGLVLAPLCVLPEYQNQGIGGKLIEELENIALYLGFKFISILGNPDYYGKFGYSEAKNYNISAPFEVDSKYFLIKELEQHGLKEVKGTLIYSSAFE